MTMDKMRPARMGASERVPGVCPPGPNTQAFVGARAG